MDNFTLFLKIFHRRPKRTHFLKFSSKTKTDIFEDQNGHILRPKRTKTKKDKTKTDKDQNGQRPKKTRPKRTRPKKTKTKGADPGKSLGTFLKNLLFCCYKGLGPWKGFRRPPSRIRQISTKICLCVEIFSNFGLKFGKYSISLSIVTNIIMSSLKLFRTRSRSEKPQVQRSGTVGTKKWSF